MHIPNLLFPEGPAFDQEGYIWCVEQDGASLARTDLSTYTTTRFIVGGRPNGIAIDSKQKIWFCDSGENAIRKFDPVNEQCTTIVSMIEGYPLNMPNDLAFDLNGNALFSCPGPSLTEKDGYVCVWTKNHTIKKTAENLYYPNGLAFTPDMQQVVLADTGTQTLWKYKWDVDACELKEQTFFANTGGAIGPDGMAFDEEGFLYVAIYGSSMVKVYSPNGQLYAEHLLAGKNPTNCAFDPNKKNGLAVTEGETGSIFFLPIYKRGCL